MKYQIVLFMMVILATMAKGQNVGIGTNSPMQKLHLLNGKIYLQDNRANNSPHVIFDNPSGVNYKEGGLQWHRAGDTLASLNYVANPNTANYISFSVSGKSAVDLLVNSNGRTGLGFTNPGAKLHVRDADASNILILEALNPTVQFRRNAGGVIPAFEDVGFIQTSDNNFRIGTNSSNLNGKFVVRVGGGDRMFVDGSGNVSIGTTNTAVGYMLNVGGKAICEELKVQLEGNWPDYVFDKKYQLMPLDRLQSFIQQHKHLPNIPEAAAVEKNGIEVGDMQRRLMEKVEELTLYILELKTEIDLLKKSVK